MDVAGGIGLGCTGMSAGYDPASRVDENSVRIIHRAIELGANLIDTADVYGPFINEELVGRVIRDRRDEVVLATKVGLEYQGAEPYDNVAPARNGRPEYIRRAIGASFRRLGTDHLDLWQLHRVDPVVPVEETWGAMAEAVIADKVRALSLCEVSVWEIRGATAGAPCRCRPVRALAVDPGTVGRRAALLRRERDHVHRLLPAGPRLPHRAVPVGG